MQMQRAGRVAEVDKIGSQTDCGGQVDAAPELTALMRNKRMVGLIRYCEVAPQAFKAESPRGSHPSERVFPARLRHAGPPHAGVELQVDRDGLAAVVQGGLVERVDEARRVDRRG
jgi:hypothetical protein